MNDFFLGGEGKLDPANAAGALIVVGTQRHYLMQLRDQKTGIFYPGHWGVFGGAIEPGETAEETLTRELHEELSLTVSTISYFTEFSFDFDFNGLGRFTRRYFEVPIEPSEIEKIVLREGSAFRLFSARKLLNVQRIVPFDAFAIWLHAGRNQIVDRRR
jgi:8-oxo-dGTP pyrophosphatase MutT (NUDIX family)